MFLFLHISIEQRFENVMLEFPKEIRKGIGVIAKQFFLFVINF